MSPNTNAVRDALMRIEIDAHLVAHRLARTPISADQCSQIPDHSSSLIDTHSWKLLQIQDGENPGRNPGRGQIFFRLLALLGWQRLRCADDRVAVASVSF